MQKRLLGYASALGAVFSAVTVSGMELKKYGAFRPFAWGNLLAGLGLFALLAVVYGAALAGLFWLLDRQAAREMKKENLFGRITGNGLVVFLLLMICWIPVWLAFFPGHFSADSLTQFESYYNGDPYAHHPLIHTALLGFCMMLGIDAHPEGYATYGLALYCIVQMVLLAACVAYACSWMKRRHVPVWARVAVTLLFAIGPFYAPWPFCAQKDVLFAALVLRGYWIALHARDRFGSLMVVGITTLVGLQTFLNVAVVTGLLPTTGISLPFFSYGGTALSVQLAEMGIVLSVSRQMKPPKAG